MHETADLIACEEVALHFRFGLFAGTFRCMGANGFKYLGIQSGIRKDMIKGVMGVLVRFFIPVPSSRYRNADFSDRIAQTTRSFDPYRLRRGRP